MFTRKHYEFFARHLGIRLRDAGTERDTSMEVFLYYEVDVYVKIFEDDNPGFKEELFRNRVKQYIMGERE